MLAFDQALTSSDFRDDPYPYYRELRENAPIHWCEPWRCWVLSRYTDVLTVLQDPKRFSNRARVTNVIRREFPESALEQIRPLLSHFSQGLINVDPPDHTRLRRLVQKTFLPKTLERLKPHIQDIVDELLEPVAPSGQMDVVRDLAYPLPVTVIAELLGVPPAMRQTFKDWTATTLEFQAVPRPDLDTILKSQEALLAMRNYLDTVIQERRRSPHNDLLSELVAVEEQGDRLTHEELLSTAVGLLVAGHETTTNLIASAVWLFLQHQIALKPLLDDPAAMETAIEEVLRYESPLQRLGRTVMEDTEVAGQPVGAGETVLSLLGAANRDPRQFSDADRFDVSRTPNRHIAFGHGIHFCLGAPLARIEAPIALRSLFNRCRNPRMQAPQPQWHSGVMRGLTSLPITFEPSET